MTINPYEKLAEEALNNGADKTTVWVYQQKAEAYKEGMEKPSEETKRLKVEVKAWIKNLHGLEREGKQLIDRFVQLEKNLVLEVLKEGNNAV